MSNGLNFRTLGKKLHDHASSPRADLNRRRDDMLRALREWLASNPPKDEAIAEIGSITRSVHGALKTFLTTRPKSEESK